MYRDHYERYHGNNGQGKKLGKKFTGNHKYKPKYSTNNKNANCKNNGKERQF